MASKKKRVFENQRLFTPNVVQRYTNASGILRNQTFDSLSGSGPAPSPTGSFRFDPPGSAIKSTQQLPIDFSKFENHTFFCSAEANVNIAFEKIINQFPFDGTKEQYDEFMDKLSGFEKWVIDKFPKYTGYLTPTSSQSVTVYDRAGLLFPSLSRITSGITILDPRNNSFSVEGQFSVPETTNSSMLLFQHIVTASTSTAGTVGFTAAVTQSASDTSTANFSFMVTSGSHAISASISLAKGKFHHLNFLYDRSSGHHRAYILSASTTVAKSQRFRFPSLSTMGNPFIIASGSSVSAGWLDFTPTATFSGSINELRYFHGTRKSSDILRYASQPIFARDDLKLNIRFNEATGSYDNNDILLDYSGNSLHSRITNYDANMRVEVSGLVNEMELEDIIINPTLFPSYPTVVSLNEELLTSASRYDTNNPNLITNLIPDHYLDMAAQNYLGVNDDVDGSLLDGIGNTATAYSIPGGAKMGQPQIISALLFMWAKEFDELKAMIDHVSNLVFIDYDSEESIADIFLPFLAEYYGFELSSMFRNASYQQLFDGANVSGSGLDANALLFIQNTIWKRILINLREILSSKGTKHSIKTLFRSAGIDSDRILRFLEYGGTKELRLGSARKTITEISSMLDYSGSLSFGGGNPSYDAQGFRSGVGGSPALYSAFLSASRIEVGIPEPAGTMVQATHEFFKPHGISNDPNDGLLTSGSWTFEGRYNWPIVRSVRRRQSLFRVHVTSSVYDTFGNDQGVLLNLTADPPDNMLQTGSLSLYCRPGFYNTSPAFELHMTGVDIFDGNTWYVSAGRQRSDLYAEGYLSSSYFIRAARQSNGDLVEYYMTSSFFAESHSNNGDNAFQRKTDVTTSLQYNTSGSFIVIGSQSLGTTSSLNFLNSITSTTPGTHGGTRSRITHFDGMFGHGRFWSKFITKPEAKEHAMNFSSLGVIDPLVNFGFTPDVTGSFQKLRLDISTDQPLTESSSTGAAELIDFSQNYTDKNLTGSMKIDRYNQADTSWHPTLSGSSVGAKLIGFDASKRIIKPHRFDFSALSSWYDEISEENKVRVAGFTQGKNLFELGGLPAPVYELSPSTEPIDDARFSIEFSMMQALDEDMMKLFATLDSLDNILGSPELMFAYDYPGLVDLREVYFNRLTTSINYKQFFEFFRWLDDSFDIMIENLIPRKTNYLGFNFIVEGHALERAKITYGSGDVYLGESVRRGLKGVILLRQIVGTIRKI